jgi:8-oxo-dGTP pyrophosphatase MutT (NUDIX family)
MNNHYQPIGGKIELGETIKDTFIREAYEEAGLEFDNKSEPAFIFHYEQKGFNYFPKKRYQFVKRIVYVYELKSTTEKIQELGLMQGKEIQNFSDWKWKSINELQSEYCIQSLEKYFTYQNESSNKTI